MLVWLMATTVHCTGTCQYMKLTWQCQRYCRVEVRGKLMVAIDLTADRRRWSIARLRRVGRRSSLTIEIVEWYWHGLAVLFVIDSQLEVPSLSIYNTISHYYQPFNCATTLRSCSNALIGINQYPVLGRHACDFQTHTAQTHSPSPLHHFQCIQTRASPYGIKGPEDVHS